MDNNKEKNFVSAVVYIHNNASTIIDFITSLDRELKENFLKYEIVIVDDYSEDNSEELIKQYGNHRDGAVISLLKMSNYHGLEKSMNAGLNLAIGDFVFEFDYADAEFDWNLLMEIYRKSLSGYDIVNGMPNKKPSFCLGKYMNLFNRYARLQHPMGIDICRVLSRRAINRVHSITQTIPFRKVAYANCGLALSSVNYDTIKKLPKSARSVTISQATESFILFTDLFFRLTLYSALIMMFIAIGMGLYALILNFFRAPVEGWTTTVVFLSLGFMGMFFMMAMILKYQQVQVNLAFRKKEYLFESITKLQ